MINTEINLEPLRQFGLHKKDIAVYSSLLKLGRVKSGAIMKSAGIGSSSFYSSIDILIKKGLVSFDVKNNVRWYKPQPLNEFIEKSRDTTIVLEKLAKEITSLRPTAQERNEIDIFVGYHGLQRAFMEHIETLKRGHTVRIIGFGSKSPQRKSLDEFLNKINAAAAKKKSSMIILLDEAMRGTGSAKEFGKDKKVYYLPASYFGPMAYNISEKEVILSIWGEVPTVLRLRNKIMVQSFISNFDFLVKHAI